MPYETTGTLHALDVWKLHARHDYDILEGYWFHLDGFWPMSKSMPVYRVSTAVQLTVTMLLRLHMWWEPAPPDWLSCWLSFSHYHNY